eukprot:TRINITY_DN6152_c0_g1_i4.p1 TRINITY_DN6152_c0_g1~~TRINITY_DN6152_c0_g1_i4.p1  ORF type:complete len:145 (-),score=40.84 TRINITY_DN6152_c0_g1_i4:79-513(-)
MDHERSICKADRHIETRLHRARSIYPTYLLLQISIVCEFNLESNAIQNSKEFQNQFREKKKAMTNKKTEEEGGLDSKIVLLGDSGVGKTSLVQRYVQQNFIENQQPTIGASFLSKTIFLEERRIKLRLWDTAGQEKFRSLALRT